MSLTEGATDITIPMPTIESAAKEVVSAYRLLRLSYQRVQTGDRALRERFARALVHLEDLIEAEERHHGGRAG